MDTEVVQMLLGARADPHCEVGGKTVLDVALENKKFELSDSGKRQGKESTEDTKSSDWINLIPR